MNPLASIYHKCKASENPVLSYLYYFAFNRMNPLGYRSLYSELRDVHDWIRTIPKDFDIAVGIPRHGLLYANLIASELGKPLSTPDLLIQGKYWMTNQSGWHGDVRNARVLLIDEGTETGNTIRDAEREIRNVYPDINLRKAVLYVTRNCQGLVDTYYGLTLFGNDFELNLVHGGIGRRPLGCDLDGFLCNDYPGDRTLEDHYLHAIPYRIPHGEIEFIATGREEKYRLQTEQWLRVNNVNYKRLYMLDGQKSNAEFKCSVIRKEKPRIFIESTKKEAVYIHRWTGCRVICIEDNKMYGARK